MTPLRSWSVASRWTSTMSILDYVDLPNLAILTLLCGYRLDRSFIELHRNFRSLGLVLPYLLYEIEKLLANMHINALPVGELANWTESVVGTVVSFEKTCRTKNLSYFRLATTGTQGQIGDSKRGPVIYFVHGKWKIVVKINPRWITSDHAVTDLRSGSHRFCGLCVIQEIRAADNLIYATPIVLGTPKGRWQDIFF